MQFANNDRGSNSRGCKRTTTAFTTDSDVSAGSKLPGKCRRVEVFKFAKFSGLNNTPYNRDLQSWVQGLLNAMVHRRPGRQGGGAGRTVFCLFEGTGELRPGPAAVSGSDFGR